MLHFSDVLWDYINCFWACLWWTSCSGAAAGMFWYSDRIRQQPSAVVAVHDSLLLTNLVAEPDSYSGAQDRPNEPIVLLMYSCYPGFLWDWGDGGGGGGWVLKHEGTWHQLLQWAAGDVSDDGWKLDWKAGCDRRRDQSLPQLLWGWRRSDGPAWCGLYLGRSRLNFVLLKYSRRIKRD